MGPWEGSDEQAHANTLFALVALALGVGYLLLALATITVNFFTAIF